MVRVLLGSLIAAVAMFIIGLLFFQTPLNSIHVRSVDNVAAATVQQVLAANMPVTATYHVPYPGTPEQTVMYGQGPIATIHYNSRGVSGADAQSVIGGLVLDFVAALLMGAALIGIDRRVPDFGSRARIVALFALAGAGLSDLSLPIWHHVDWPYAIYRFVANVVILAVGGLIIARWFLPVKAAAAGQTAAPDLVSSSSDRNL